MVEHGLAKAEVMSERKDGKRGVVKKIHVSKP